MTLESLLDTMNTAITEHNKLKADLKGVALDIEKLEKDVGDMTKMAQDNMASKIVRFE